MDDANPGPASAPHDKPELVCIGASAGGLESLQALLPGLPVGHGLCYVVLQHTAPKFRSMLPEILQKHTSMTVRDLAHGDLITPDTVLVTPPNANVEFDGVSFLLSEPLPHSTPKPSINQFLMSLATHMGPRAIGVILSGTGSDGALGMRQLRAAGGSLVVQLPASARYAGMPDAVIRMVEPDFVLAPERIGAALGMLTAHPGSTGEPPRPVVDADRLQDLLLRVRRRSGLDFSEYKEGTLQRRIVRRLVARNTPDLAAYLELVTGEPEELDALVRDILISVTSFFRDANAFDALAQAVQEIVASRGTEEALRIWVPGCATGEEAYTIQIALLERLGQDLGGCRLQIFATDVDMDALAMARQGVYSLHSLEALPEEVVRRHFIVAGDQAEVQRPLRERVVFSRHDLTRDPPFPRLDVISCRNVLIYLKPAAQLKVLQSFRYALRPGGVLMLGLSEHVLDHEGAFTPVDRDHHLFRRTDSQPSIAPRPPGVSRLTQELPRSAPVAWTGDHELHLLRQAGLRFLPACVLLSEQWQVLQVHGDVSPFLALQPGRQRLDVVAMAQPALQTDLRVLCSGAPAEDATRQVVVRLPSGRTTQRWRITLHPFVRVRGERQALMSFERQTRSAGKAAGSEQPDHELELASAKEQMRSLVEQLEASNEEMQSLNEEAQAANEELQASNEEMESANEELQAANEELSTVNSELNHQFVRFRELSQELQTIQNSIDLPLLVVDRKLDLIRFNDAAARMFHLRGGSEGLPLSTLRRPEGLADLTVYVSAAMSSASPIAVPLPTTPDQRDFVLHLSHHVVDGERLGLVLTLVDTTELGRAERIRAQLEQRLMLLLSNGRAMFAIKDTTGRYEFVNHTYANFFGLEPEGMVGRTDQQCLEPTVASRLRSADLAVLSAPGPMDGEDHFDIGGAVRHWLSTRFVIPHADGTIEAVCVQATDITALRAADAQLRIADQVVAATAEGVMITDAQLHIVRINPAFTRITGYTEDEALGQRPTLLQSGRQGPEFYQTMWNRLHEHGHWRGNVWNRKRDGSLYLERLAIDPLRDRHGQVTHYVAVFSDITELEHARHRIEEMATHDSLTGLPNRALLTDRLMHAIQSAQRAGSELAVCFIDLDNFKTINDSLGHEAGDELLCIAARRVRDSIRAADTLARLGGDEFVVLLEHTTRQECLVGVQRLTRVLSQHCTLKGATLTTEGSIGIAMYPHDGDDAATLMRHADAAMYRAKAAGRGTYEFFSSELGESAHSRLGVESGLRQAIGAGELWLAYQAQFDVQTLELSGIEALLRWQPRNGAALSPSVFLPVAEESGLIEELGDWVMNQACGQVAVWRNATGDALNISINVSPRQLQNPRFVEKVQERLVAHQLPAEALTLEITETALMHERAADGSNGTIGKLRRLRALGCRISLDDFGTGHSSLTRLRELPLDELKVDRSFVRGLTSSHSDRQIVAAVVELGHALGLRVVAEGVETDQHLEQLRETTVPLQAQGFAVARPVSADEFEDWMQERKAHDIACRLDAVDRIVALEGLWHELVPPDDAQPVTPVVGRPLSEFIVGESSRAYLRSVLALARSSGAARRLPYRCDSPVMRRDLEMIIHPYGDDTVVIRHRLLRRAPLPQKMVFASDDDGPWWRCCQCLSLRPVSGGAWSPPEQVPAHELGDMPVRVRYDVCPRCTALAAA